MSPRRLAPPMALKGRTRLQNRRRAASGSDPRKAAEFAPRRCAAPALAHIRTRQLRCTCYIFGRAKSVRICAQETQVEWVGKLA